jgi:hypothetical protein
MQKVTTIVSRKQQPTPDDFPDPARKEVKYYMPHLKDEACSLKTAVICFIQFG